MESILWALQDLLHKFKQNAPNICHVFLLYGNKEQV